MKVTVMHDAYGRIISISRLGDMKEAGTGLLKIGMVPRPGQHIVDLQLSKELKNKPLLELHKGYQVDLKKSRLVKIREFTVPDREGFFQKDWQP